MVTANNYFTTLTSIVSSTVLPSTFWPVLLAKGKVIRMNSH